MMHYNKTMTAQATKATEAITLAKEIACYTNAKFPAVKIMVQAEELADEVAVHFEVAAEVEALAHVHEQSAADGLLKILARQFAQLFMNGCLQDVYCGDEGVTAVA